MQQRAATSQKQLRNCPWKHLYQDNLRFQANKIELKRKTETERKIPGNLFLPSLFHTTDVFYFRCATTVRKKISSHARPWQCCCSADVVLFTTESSYIFSIDKESTKSIVQTMFGSLINQRNWETNLCGDNRQTGVRCCTGESLVTLPSKGEGTSACAGSSPRRNTTTGPKTQAIFVAVKWIWIRSKGARHFREKTILSAVFIKSASLIWLSLAVKNNICHGSKCSTYWRRFRWKIVVWWGLRLLGAETNQRTFFPHNVCAWQTNSNVFHFCLFSFDGALKPSVHTKDGSLRRKERNACISIFLQKYLACVLSSYEFSCQNCYHAAHIFLTKMTLTEERRGVARAYLSL